jgi:hypothetical protein
MPVTPTDAPRAFLPEAPGGGWQFGDRGDESRASGGWRRQKKRNEWCFWDSGGDILVFLSSGQLIVKEQMEQGFVWNESAGSSQDPVVFENFKEKQPVFSSFNWRFLSSG